MSFGRIIDLFTFSKYQAPLVFTETQNTPVKAAPKRVRRNLEAIYPEAAGIKVLVDGNPKRAGSVAERQFNKLKSCGTVREAMGSGWSLSALDQEVQKEHIHVG